MPLSASAFSARLPLRSLGICACTYCCTGESCCFRACMLGTCAAHTASRYRYCGSDGDLGLKAPEHPARSQVATHSKQAQSTRRSDLACQHPMAHGPSWQFDIAGLTEHSHLSAASAAAPCCSPPAQQHHPAACTWSKGAASSMSHVF